MRREAARRTGRSREGKGWQGCAMWAGESVLVPGRVGAGGGEGKSHGEHGMEGLRLSRIH